MTNHTPTCQLIYSIILHQVSPSSSCLCFGQGENMRNMKELVLLAQDTLKNRLNEQLSLLTKMTNKELDFFLKQRGLEISKTYEMGEEDADGKLKNEMLSCAEEFIRKSLETSGAVAESDPGSGGGSKKMNSVRPEE